jgi:predicted nucleic acid-binding protein
MASAEWSSISCAQIRAWSLRSKKISVSRIRSRNRAIDAITVVSIASKFQLRTYRAEQEQPLERAGWWLPVEDRYIAATTRRAGLTIATGNDQDLRRPGLKVSISSGISGRRALSDSDSIVGDVRRWPADDGPQIATQLLPESKKRRKRSEIVATALGSGARNQVHRAATWIWRCRGVAQPGRASGSGPEGRWSNPVALTITQKPWIKLASMAISGIAYWYLEATPELLTGIQARTICGFRDSPRFPFVCATPAASAL